MIAGYRPIIRFTVPNSESYYALCGESGQLVSGAYRLRGIGRGQNPGAVGHGMSYGARVGGGRREAGTGTGGAGRIGPLGNEKSPGGADLTGDRGGAADGDLVPTVRKRGQDHKKEAKETDCQPT